MLKFNKNSSKKRTDFNKETLKHKNSFDFFDNIKSNTNLLISFK